MNSNRAALQSLWHDGSRRSYVLSTPPLIDYGTYDAGGDTASRRAEELSRSSSGLTTPQLGKWFLSPEAYVHAQCHFCKAPVSVAVIRAFRDITELLFQHGGSIKKGKICSTWLCPWRKPDCLETVRMLQEKVVVSTL